MLRFVLISFIVVINFASLAQRGQFIDSLRSVVDKGGFDTLTVNACFQLSRQYNGIGNQDSSYYFLNKAKLIASSINFQRGKVEYFARKGAYHVTFNQADSAIYFLEKSIKKADEINFHKMTGHAYFYLAICYKDKRNYEEAITNYKYARAFYEKIGEYQWGAQTLLNISQLYDVLLNDHLNAIKYAEKAIVSFRKAGFSIGIANSFNRLGMIYVFLGEHEKAIEEYDSALVYAPLDSSMQLAQSQSIYNNKSLVYKEMGDLEASFKSIRRAIQIAEHFDATRSICFGYGNIGDFYLLKEDSIETGFEYLMKAYDLSKELEDDYVTASLNTSLGNYYSIRGNYKKSLEFYEVAKKLFDKNDFTDGLDINLKGLYKAYKNLNMHSKALNTYEELISFQERVKKDEVKSELANMKWKHDLDVQIKENQIQESLLEISAKESENRKAQRNIILIGLLGLVVVAVLLFRSMRMKQKSFEIISKQKKVVEQKNKEILSSIEYAKKIQNAILPSKEIVRGFLPDSFIYFRPKDIVSGDFYWFEKLGSDIYISAADCTGHGVPGAMVSVICSNSLTKTVKEIGIKEPAKILDMVADIVEARFDKTGEDEIQDGMDLALCRINQSEMQLEYSGAHNPLWIVRNNEIIEYKANPQPIGKYFAREPFTNHSIQLEKGDSIYMFSDGFQDQFGGEKGKKYKAKPFQKFLISIQGESMEKQHDLINAEFERWCGSEQQIDDVCVIGVRV